MQPSIDCLVAPAAQTAPLVRLVGGVADAATVEVSRPAGKAMSSCVLLERNEFKILEAVVLLVAVLVVNAFVRLEFTTEMLSHDIAVLGSSRPIRQTELNVTSGVCPPTTSEPFGSLSCSVCSGTGHAAVHDRAVLELAGGEHELFPAVPTGSRRTLLLSLRAASDGAGYSPLRLTRDGLESNTADLADDGFHSGILHDETENQMSVAAKTYTIITETT